MTVQKIRQAYDATSAAIGVGSLSSSIANRERRLYHNSNSKTNIGDRILAVIVVAIRIAHESIARPSTQGKAK